MNTTVGRRTSLRPYAADTGVALVVLAVLYAPLVIPRVEQPGPYSPWVWIFLAGSALPLVVRRRFPIACLTVIYASLLAYNTLDDAVSEPIGWGVLVAVYSIAWVGRRWQQICVLALVTVGSLASMKSPTLTSVASGIAAMRIPAATVAPKAPAPVVNPESAVVTITPVPSTSSNTRLRRRRASGFGRLLRGTAHARLKAFCVAPATPRQP